MAGFFGLFNYAKEGPGIEKNAPKKKTFIVFFETFFRNFWKFIPINLMYCLIWIIFPLNGLACAGLTNVTRNTARDKHSFGLSDFFETIHRNWKQALPAGIINTLIYALLIFDLYFFWYNSASDSILPSVCFGVGFAILLIFFIMNFYIWTLMITFRFRLGQLYRNSFKFVFINFKNNLLCSVIIVALFAAGVAVMLLIPYAIVLMLLFVLTACCAPAFRFLLIQYCTFPSIKKFVIDPYYDEHPGEDIEKRKALGLDIPEEKTADEDSADEDALNDSVFED